MHRRQPAQSKPIPGYDDYRVDRNGDVYSSKHGRWRKLKCWPNSKGYGVVYLCKHGSRHRFMIHKLVAAVFLRRKRRGEEVRHWNGDKRNNAARNLRWGTHAQNVMDTLRHGTHVSIACPERMARGEKHGSKTMPHRILRGESSATAKITNALVRAIRRMKARGSSISHIARFLQIPRGATKCVVQGKTWRHIA
jgi:HNH endonuclease